MSVFSSSKRHNSCPICESTSGECRQHREDENFWLCMTYADTRKGEVIAGYVSIGQTKDGLWGQFKLKNSQELNEQQWLEWQRENQRRKQERIREDNEKRLRSLAIVERDKNYRQLLDELTLHPDDRADLVRRGFTYEQIELSGFKSIDAYQQLKSRYNELLPGIKDSNKLIITNAGYLCPVRNTDGLIVACQVRIRSLRNDETNRYRWLSGGNGQTLHLYPEGCKPEGELPLAVFHHNDKPEGIALAEGTGAKPFLAAQRLNLLVIGAAGGQWASSPQLFRSILEETALDNKSIKIFPDAGDILNQSVMYRWQRVISLLAEWGYPVAVGWWGQVDKSHSDIDELDDLSKIQFISPIEFLNKGENTKWPANYVANPEKRRVPCRLSKELSLQKSCNWNYLRHTYPHQQEGSYTSQSGEKKSGSIKPSLISSNQGNFPDTQLSSDSSATKKSVVSISRLIRPIPERKKAAFHVIRTSQYELLERFDALESKRGQEWLHLREFTPDVIINSQYFDYDFKPDENLAIKSGLGTGKSYFANAKWLANPDEGAVLGGYRNCLNEQFCANGEKLNGRAWNQIQQDLKGSADRILLSDPQSRIAGAVDSFSYFSNDNFDGKRGLFDEVESVAKHTNQSNTAVALYRDIVKDRVSSLTQKSIANLIADGNLRDYTVDYFEKISGRKFTKIENKYQGNRGHIYLWNGSARKVQASEKDVEAGRAAYVGEWITYKSNPNDESKLHRIMMELPIDLGMLILSDSQAKCEAWDRGLTALGRKVFRLDSTSSQTDLGIAFLQNPKEFILSQNIDCVILSPSAESGVSIELLNELDAGCAGFFKYEFAFFYGVSTTDTQCQFLGRNRDPYTKKFVYVSTHSFGNSAKITDQDTSSSLIKGWMDLATYCAELSLKGISDGALLGLVVAEVNRKVNDPHMSYESKVTIKESFERANPRNCLEYALREAGWKVTVIEGAEDSLEDLRATQNELSKEKAEAIFAAQDIGPVEAEKLSWQLNKTPEQRQQIAKAKIIAILPGIQDKQITDVQSASSLAEITRIEQSPEKQIISVDGVPYEEWKQNPPEITEKGAKVTVTKPAFDAEMVEKITTKDRGFISRLENQFLLRNPEICKLLQQQKWHKRLATIFDPESSSSLNGLNLSGYRSKLVEIHTLLEIGLAFFLDENSRWHNKSSQAIAFWKKGSQKKNVKLTGISPELDPCAYIGKILGKFGLKAQSQQKTVDGVRTREYSISPMDSLSQAAFECVTERINKRVSDAKIDWEITLKNASSKSATNQSEHVLHTAHLALENHIDYQGEVCSVQGDNSRTRTLTEELAEALEFAESAKMFAIVTEDVAPDIVVAAIASTTQPHQNQLRIWLQALPARNLGEFVANAFNSGVEAIKAALLSLSQDERWEAVTEFEKLVPQKMEELAQKEPNWFQWCDA